MNYVYGTGGVLRALEALGLADRDDAQIAAQWLRSVQNPDGGFGETCASYDDEEMKGKGPSTPSQTAWGLIGLLAAAAPNDPTVMGCIRYLTQHQKDNGSWNELATTRTGFPTVFHLKYHLYCIYFPLYALARFRNIQKGAEPFCGVLVSPHQFERRNGARVNR